MSSRFTQIVFLLVAVVSVVSFTAPACAHADKLDSPAYTEYNTFLGAVNFLELASVGTSSISAVVTVYAIDGSIVGTRSLTLSSGSQTDVNINSLVGLSDTYGTVKVTFSEGTGKELRGRMATYNPNGNGTYSFAIAKELREPLSRNTYAISNSFDAQGRGYKSPNWMSLTNLHTASVPFTYRQYDPQGNLIREQTITLAPKERRDIQAGHEDGEVVYLNQISPPSSTVRYLAYVTRYGTNTDLSIFQNQVYAVPLPFKSGDDAEQFTLISDRNGDCWQQTNWVEVANTGSSSQTVYLTFRRQDGSAASSTSMSLPAKNQFHFNATSILRLGGKRNDFGFVRVYSDSGADIIAQSSIYTHACDRNTLHTAYTVPSLKPDTYPIAGSYNTFLDINNRLFLMNTSRSGTDVDLTLRHDGNEIYQESITFDDHESMTFNLSEEETYQTQEDTIGTFSVGPSTIDGFIGFLVRERFTDTTNETFDFAMPTPVQ